MPEKGKYEKMQKGAAPPAEYESRGVGDAAKGFIGGGISDALDSLRKELEGPYPLRMICAIGGIAVAVASALNALSIFNILNPRRWILLIYQTVFGLVIATVELKDVPCGGDKLKDFCYKWMPFLTVCGGKGAFYAFVGSLGMAFGIRDFLIFIPSCFIIVCGIVLVFFHFGQCSSLQEKYDETIRLEAQTQKI